PTPRNTGNNHTSTPTAHHRSKPTRAENRFPRRRGRLLAGITISWSPGVQVAETVVANARARRCETAGVPAPTFHLSARTATRMADAKQDCLAVNSRSQ